MGKAIGNRNSTRVWQEAWIRAKTLVRPIGPAREDDLDIYVSDLLLRGSGEWEKQNIHRLLPAYAEHIFCMRPSQLGVTDKFVWPLNSSGTYSTKSGYYETVKQQEQEENRQPQNLINSQDRLQSFNWIRNIWSVKTAPKIQVFLWKIVQDALPIEEAL